jgi:hypothetical protein
LGHHERITAIGIDALDHFGLPGGARQADEEPSSQQQPAEARLAHSNPPLQGSVDDTKQV